jgi:hypothetical protein
MESIEARLAALVAHAILAVLAEAGAGGLTPDGSARVQEWLGHAIELALFVGRMAIPIWLQARAWALPGDPVGAAVTIRLDEELERRLDELCERSGKTSSEVVREALRREVALMGCTAAAEVGGRGRIVEAVGGREDRLVPSPPQ